MKHWKRGLCGLLAAVLMVPAGLAAPVSGEKGLSDLEGHWAQKEVEAAVASGWVDGYPDGSFKPEKSITRAEFTKMLLDAIHLTPDSELVAWMKVHAKMEDIWGKSDGIYAEAVRYERPLADQPGVAGRGAVLRHGGTG